MRYKMGFLNWKTNYKDPKKLRSALRSIVGEVPEMRIAEVVIDGVRQHAWVADLEGTADFLAQVIPSDVAAECRSEEDLRAVVFEGLKFRALKKNPGLAMDNNFDVDSDKHFLLMNDYITSKFGDIGYACDGTRYADGLYVGCRVPINPRYTYFGRYGDGFVMTFDGGVVGKYRDKNVSEMLKKMFCDVSYNIIRNGQIVLGAGGCAPLDTITDRIEFFEDYRSYEEWCQQEGIEPWENPLPFNPPWKD